MAWTIAATALVLLMIPGVGYGTPTFSDKAEAVLTSGSQVLLLWACETKERVIADMALGNGDGCCVFPMVLLGLFPYILALCRQIHGGSGKLRL